MPILTDFGKAFDNVRHEEFLEGRLILYKY